MTETDIIRELRKLKYHIKILSQTIDSERFPVEALVLEMDWDEKQLDRAHDIFEEYNSKIEAKEQIAWPNFEMALKNEFNIGYQTVKSIVLAFYENDQWVEVCRGYAMSFEPNTPIEFHRITRSGR